MIPRGLGRVDPRKLSCERGRGNTLTCFAENAVPLWEENIPPPTVISRKDRRELIYALAATVYLSPIQTVQVVRYMHQRERVR